jgi:uncharacterized Zn finger protein (UPF0148 family)
VGIDARRGDTMTTGIQVLDALNVTSKMIQLEQELWALANINTTLDSEAKTYAANIGYALHKLHEHLTEQAGATHAEETGAEFPALRCEDCNGIMGRGDSGTFVCPVCETFYTPDHLKTAEIDIEMWDEPGDMIRAQVETCSRRQHDSPRSRAVMAWWELKGRDMHR